MREHYPPRQTKCLRWRVKSFPRKLRDYHARRSERQQPGGAHTNVGVLIGPRAAGGGGHSPGLTLARAHPLGRDRKCQAAAIRPAVRLHQTSKLSADYPPDCSLPTSQTRSRKVILPCSHNLLLFSLNPPDLSPPPWSSSAASSSSQRATSSTNTPKTKENANASKCSNSSSSMPSACKPFPQTNARLHHS